MTERVASGVRSVGENPVPPVVTSRPANDEERSLRADGDGRHPVRDDPPLDDPVAVAGQCSGQFLS